MRFVGMLLAGLLMACQPTTIDASSAEAARRSMEEITAELSPEKRQEFQEAAQMLLANSVLGAMGTAFTAAMAGEKVDSEAMTQDLMASLDGKTADEVIAEAKRIREGREQEQAEQQRKMAERERQRELEELQELNSKREASEAARAQLAKFEVLHSRFYKREQAYMGPQSVIELKVRNGTDHPISRAYFRGTLATPGRAVAWHEDEFNYSISGGLEPGEIGEWTLSPNMFSGWGAAEMKPGAVFTIEVVRLDGPDGEQLFADEWTEHNEERLVALLNEYGTE